MDTVTGKFFVNRSANRSAEGDEVNGFFYASVSSKNYLISIKHEAGHLLFVVTDGSDVHIAYDGKRHHDSVFKLTEDQVAQLKSWMGGLESGRKSKERMVNLTDAKFEEIKNFVYEVTDPRIIMELQGKGMRPQFLSYPEGGKNGVLAYVDKDGTGVIQVPDGKKSYEVRIDSNGHLSSIGFDGEGGILRINKNISRNEEKEIIETFKNFVNDNFFDNIELSKLGSLVANAVNTTPAQDQEREKQR